MALRDIDVSVLLGLEWPEEQIERIYHYAERLGYTFDRALLSSRVAVLKHASRASLVIHPTWTLPGALEAWEDVPAGSLVGAWTDGSGVVGDASVGAAAVLKLPIVAFPTNRSDSSGQFIASWSCGPGTNNLAELSAIGLGLACCPRTDLRLHIFSDSEYGIGSLTKDWKTKKNKKLIHDLHQLLNLRPATFEHVAGHAGIEGNELADYWAGKARIKASSQILDLRDVGPCGHPIHSCECDRP